MRWATTFASMWRTERHDASCTQALMRISRPSCRMFALGCMTLSFQFPRIAVSSTLPFHLCAPIFVARLSSSAVVRLTSASRWARLVTTLAHWTFPPHRRSLSGLSTTSAIVSLLLIANLRDYRSGTTWPVMLRPRCHREWSVPVGGGSRSAPEEHKLVTDAYDHLEVSRIAEVTLDECQRLDGCLPRRLATENG